MTIFHSVEKYKKKLDNLVKLIGGDIQYNCMPRNIYDINNTKNIQKKILLTTTDNKTQELTEIKKITHGSYGTVIIYETEIDKQLLAIKFPKNKDSLENDIKIIKYLQQNNICMTQCINSKIIEINDENAILMEYMDGALHNIMLDPTKLPDVIKGFIIIKNIAQTLNTLAQNNLLYTDIKQGNFLYKCQAPNDIKIIIGDLGSIIRRNSTNECIATYPPIDRVINTITKRQLTNRPGSFYNPTDHDIVWGIAILFFEIFNIPINEFTHRNIATNWGTHGENSIKIKIALLMEQFIRRIKNEDIIAKISALIDKCFKPNPKDRIQLGELTEQITVLSNEINQLDNTQQLVQSPSLYFPLLPSISPGQPQNQQSTLSPVQPS